MKENSKQVAKTIVVLQIIAWVFAVGPFFGTSHDPSGMGKGMAILFITAPSMAFIFVSNLYLVFKGNLGKWFKILSVINLLGLLFLNSRINW